MKSPDFTCAVSFYCLGNTLALAVCSKFTHLHLWIAFKKKALIPSLEKKNCLLTTRKVYSPKTIGLFLCDIIMLALLQTLPEAQCGEKSSNWKPRVLALVFASALHQLLKLDLYLTFLILFFLCHLKQEWGTTWSYGSLLVQKTKE